MPTSEPTASPAASPAASGSAGENYAFLLRLIYDATGLQRITVQTAPLVAWVFDLANPLTVGAVPVGVAPMTPAPPETAPIVSPRWAVVYPAGDAIVFTENEVWHGIFADFLLWLATNNGASRMLQADLGSPVLFNIWNTFARTYPQYVYGVY